MFEKCSAIGHQYLCEWLCVGGGALGILGSELLEKQADLVTHCTLLSYSVSFPASSYTKNIFVLLN